MNKGLLVPALSTFAFLAACASSGPPVTMSPLTFAEAVAQKDAMKARLDARSNSAFSAIPSIGTADFAGFSSVTISDPAGTVDLVGTTSLQVNFLARSISGTMTNFQGGKTATPESYVGTLTLANGLTGTISDITPGPAVKNDLSADISGTLSGEGSVYAVTGGITGKFKADPIRGLVADSTGSTSATVNGGASAPTTIAVVAELQ